MGTYTSDNTNAESSRFLKRHVVWDGKLDRSFGNDIFSKGSISMVRPITIFITVVSTVKFP